MPVIHFKAWKADITVRRRKLTFSVVGWRRKQNFAFQRSIYAPAAFSFPLRSGPLPKVVRKATQMRPIFILTRDQGRPGFLTDLPASGIKPTLFLSLSLEAITMRVDTFTIDTHSSGKPLKCAAKRYRPHGASSSGRPAPGHILIFTHGTGFHKEHWEVPILQLFAHSKSGGTKVSEAWSIDWQTHGDSAALNEAVIEAPDFEFSEFDYAEACANLYRTFLLENIEKGLNKVVLLGHSAGAASASLATMFCDHPLFEAFIFVEPTIWPAEMAGVDAPVYKYVKRGILTRRDHWPTKAEAKRYFEGRAPWSYWDSRIREIYVEYGLKPDPVRGGWTLKCTPKHELAPFANDQKAVDVLPELNKTIKVVPIHLIYGGRNDMFSRKKQDSLLGGGRKFASVTRIPDAGHLVVQEAPDEVADVLFGILRKLDRAAGHFEVQAKL